MRKLNGSIIAFNRKAFVLLSVMLSLVAFGVLSWRISAQRADEADKRQAAHREDLSKLSPAKLARRMKDEELERLAVPADQRGVVADQYRPSAIQGNPVIFAYNSETDRLISFNANTPADILLDVEVTGIDLAGGEFISGIDFRPSNGVLYGVATRGFPGTDRVVTINTTTGEVTFVNAGTTFVTTADSFFGTDFNPVPDLIRQAGDADTNRRLNPTTGALAGTDTNLAYVAGDPGVGVNPLVNHVAYANNTPGATSTTMYGIDVGRNTLVRVGGIGGNPSPNTGQLTTVGPLGLDPTNFGAFDIQQGTDIGYAILNISNEPTLCRVNLATGQASVIGVIGDGSGRMDGMAIQFAANGGIADLSITKTDNRTTGAPGSAATYVITASNAGPDPVVGATVTDTFPASLTGVTWTCAGANGGSCSAANGTGNISSQVSLPSGGSVTFTASATVAANATGTISNTASIAAPTGVGDGTQANNSATDTTTVAGATPTPTPTPTATPTPTPTPTPTATPTPTPTPTATPTPTPTATPTPTPTATPTPTPAPVTFVAFSAATYRDDESQSARITFNRTGVTTGTSTVTFSTVAGGTASGGATCTGAADYQITTQTVTFAANSTSQFVDVPLCPDLIATDVNETVNLSLTNPSAGTGIGTPGTAVLTINDTANQFRNTAAISILRGTASNPYPSSINVTGATNTVFRVRVTLYDLYHELPDNIDVLLVGPNGARYVIMGDTGGAVAVPETGHVTLTFADYPNATLPDGGPLATGIFKPTTCETPVTNFPAPAPVGPYVEPGCLVARPTSQSFFGNYANTTANGTWSLYVRDDNGVARPLETNAPNVVTGAVGGGWGIELLPATSAGVEISGRILTSDGRGLRNAVVTMTDAAGNIRRATTGSFGYYRFEDVEVGSTQVLAVQSQRYNYTSRFVNVVDSVTDMDFSPME